VCNCGEKGPIPTLASSSKFSRLPRDFHDFSGVQVSIFTKNLYERRAGTFRCFRRPSAAHPQLRFGHEFPWSIIPKRQWPKTNKTTPPSRLRSMNEL
jgi:hypothetical protein